MSNDEPVYYRVLTDVDISEHLDDFNDEDAVRYITDTPVDPMDEGEGYYEEHAARATGDELAAWGKAYATFQAETARADADLEHARAAWEKAQSIHSDRLRDAWNDYAPTDTAVAQRRDEVVAMRRKAEEEEREAEARAKQEAQDREDAELGPRTWITYHPNSSSVKVSPDMMVPVIHLAECKATGGAEHLPYRNEYRFARKADVQETLLAGAPRYARGRATNDLLPTKLCGRCKPQESLRQALGAVYDEWLAKVENTQPPMPTPKGVAGALGLKDEWRSYRTPGYTVVSDQYYRAEELIEPHEALIGWYDPAREVVTPNQEKLARLEEILPERGFAVRRVKEPARYHVGDKESETAVAVRRMTKAEIRQRKEDAAATARYREGES